MRKLKRFRIMVLVICLIITINCQSQTTINDSCTCIPNSDLRKGVYLIEKGKADALILEETNKKVDILNNQIGVLQKIIDEYEVSDTAYQAIVESYRREVDNLVKQREVAVEAAKKLDKLLRRQKRKTIIAIAGTAIVVGGIFILAK